MPAMTLTSREFNQDTARAKRAADSGPVIITDRGEPAHVLMNIDDYRRLSARPKSLVEALAMEEDIDLESVLPDRTASNPRVFDFD